MPCRYCQTHNYVCVTTQPRKKRGTYYYTPGAAPGPDVAARAVLLEGLVKGLVPGADTASVERLRALGRALGIPLPDVVHDGTVTAADDAPAEADDDFDAGQGDGIATRYRDEVVDNTTGWENGLPDCAGQTQYVGANSSYMMQLRVRALLTGTNDPACFFLFSGSPAGTEEETLGGLQACAVERDLGIDAQGLLLNHSRADTRTPVDANALIAAYFAHIHPSFPVLDEAAFRASYAGFLRQDGAGADPAWLCSLYCVFLLARPFAHVGREPPPGVEDASSSSSWWRRVRGLLPAVLLASTPAAVAALLLAAAHLNHTNRRDSCWTLTGAAARIAVAVGLHRPAAVAPADDDDDTDDAPGSWARRRRRRRYLDALWWALCHFERLQAASLDRPSALAEASVPVPASPERTLSLLLARACRLARTPVPESSSATASSLAPAVAHLLHDLTHWRAALPPDLRRPDNDDGVAADAVRSSPGRRAAVLRLHVEHQHVLCVAARGALLRRCRADGVGPSSPPLDTADDLVAVAVRAARESIDLLLALADLPVEDEAEAATAAALNPYAGWDLYFLYQAVLVLGLYVASMRGAGTAVSPSSAGSDAVLLGRAARVAARVEADPRVPGTMRRYAVVIREVDGLVRQQQQQQSSSSSTKSSPEEVKWVVRACEPAAPLTASPPSHEDMLGVMSQVSFAMPSPELLGAPFGFVDGGLWMGPREGWGDFMGFGT